ncbi:hypothetical protein DN594_21510, partial [Enterobacter cloacae]
NMAGLQNNSDYLLMKLVGGAVFFLLPSVWLGGLSWGGGSGGGGGKAPRAARGGGGRGRGGGLWWGASWLCEAIPGVPAPACWLRLFCWGGWFLGLSSHYKQQ